MKMSDASNLKEEIVFQELRCKKSAAKVTVIGKGRYTIAIQRHFNHFQSIISISYFT